MAMATPMRSILIEMAQNMKQLTARVITDQVDIGALILMIDDHNIETHCKGDQVEANTGGDHSP